MKCTVIGGAGFIGSHLTSALVQRGHEVTAFDRPGARYLEYVGTHGARLIQGDFLNPLDLRQALIDCDVVYHLVSATIPQSSNVDPAHDVDANILGTLRLLTEARGAKVSKIVFASSGGTVYGIPQELPIRETHPTDPISSYGIAKLTIEKYLHLYWTLHGLEYCILRMANAYGERQPTDGSQGAIGAFMLKALQNETITIWGDGSVVRDYVYAGDIADALQRAAEYSGEPRIFNIGSGQGHTLNDIVKMIEGIVQRPLQVSYGPARAFDVPSNVLDIARAAKYLNWQPSTGLGDGIFLAYDWMLKEQVRR